MNMQKIFNRIPVLYRIYRKLLGPKRYSYLYEYIHKVQPKNIMEIGVWDGEQARAMIKTALEHNEGVTYYGFDLFEDMDPALFQEEVAKQPPAMDTVKRRLEKTGATIHLYKGDTQKSLPKYTKKLPKMDFIYIDGGHSLETIENDWKYVKKLMHKDTVVIFDDYWNRDDTGCKPLIESLDRSEYDVEILPLEDRFIKDWGTLTINLVAVKRA